ncbi:MAG: 50S ribosomal protein L10 [Planctomycetota bacterium]
MSRAIKELVEQQIQTRYKSLDSVMIVNVHGLTGVEANLVRGKLRKQKIEMHVVKNRAAKRILTGTVLEPIGKHLTGPCAFVTGGSSPVETAKELLKLREEYPKLELRTGLVDGETTAITIEEISKRRSKNEIIGEVLMLATSPGRRIAGSLNTGGKVAGCIKAIIEKLEKGEAITKVA